MGTFATPDGPPLVQAAGLVLAYLRATGAATWSELVAMPDERLRDLGVTSDQLTLMNEHRDAIGLIKADKPPLTLAVCPGCGRFAVVASAAPSTCNLTVGCGGRPVRVTAAARAKAPEQPDQPDTIAPDEEPVEPDQGQAPEPLDVHVHVHVSGSRTSTDHAR